MELDLERELEVETEMNHEMAVSQESAAGQESEAGQTMVSKAAETIACPIVTGQAAVPDTEKSFAEVMDRGGREDLEQLKSWLFAENIRMEAVRSEIAQMEQKFATERRQFQDEMKALNKKLMNDKKRLKDETAFFDKKMEILKSGFSQLDMDKRKFEKEKMQFLSGKEAASWEITYGRHKDMVEMLFRGVNSPLALKKRYKDLIKMFHPDNVAGDHEMVLVINKVYEKLKDEYEMERQA